MHLLHQISNFKFIIFNNETISLLLNINSNKT